MEYSDFKQILDATSAPCSEFTLNIHELKAETFSETLLHWRLDFLNSKSRVVTLSNGKSVRVYPGDSSAKPLDEIFIRGIDIARAAVELFKLDNKGTQFDLDLLVNKVKTYAQSRLTCATEKEAYSHFVSFYNEILEEFKTARVDSGDTKQTEEALAFMRDFLWNKDCGGDFCFVEKNQESPVSYYLSFAEKVIYKPDQPYSPWDMPQSTPLSWYGEMQARLGNKSWFQEFCKENYNLWKTMSSTPMARFSPNPANAWIYTDYLVKPFSESVHAIGGINKTAVTEPYEVKHPEERERLTQWNHAQLFSPETIAKTMSHYWGIWGFLHQTNQMVNLPMLHQTLLADGVAFSSDQRKTKKRSTLGSKLKANGHLRERFKNKIYYYNPEDQSVSETFKAGFIPFEVDLRQTNHCINIWEKPSRIRNNDLDDGRALVIQATAHFRKLREKCPHPTLTMIIDFLESSDYSWFTDYKSYEKSGLTKKNLAELFNAICNGSSPFASVPEESRYSIALSLQAALELKCTHHETYAGQLRRRIDNYSRDTLRQPGWFKLGYVADGLIRASTTLLSGSKWLVPWNWPKLFKQQAEKSKALWMACYEVLLQQELGMVTGGCMSAVDRAGELYEMQRALKKQFIQENHFIGYNSTHSERETVLKNYSSTRFKHCAAEQSTGTTGTKDTEAIGIVKLNLKGKRINVLGFLPRQMPTKKESPAISTHSYWMQKLRDPHPSSKKKLEKARGVIPEPRV